MKNFLGMLLLPFALALVVILLVIAQIKAIFYKEA